MFLVAIAFTALWRHIVRTPGLLQTPLSGAVQRAAVRRFGLGLLAYGALCALAFISPLLTLGGHFAVAVYYAFEQLPAPLRGGGAAGPDVRRAREAGSTAPAADAAAAGRGGLSTLRRGSASRSGAQHPEAGRPHRPRRGGPGAGGRRPEIASRQRGRWWRRAGGP